MSDDRGTRLHLRFEAIREALAQVHGEPLSRAAAYAAWLMTVEHTMKIGIRQLTRFAALDKVSEEAARERAKIIEEEFNAMLQSFHKEVCKDLGVNASDAWALTKHFEAIIHDLLNEGG